MIEPTVKDVGRGVVYESYPGNKEDGIITSFNNTYVFVKFTGNNSSQAVDKHKLEWLKIKGDTNAKN